MDSTQSGAGICTKLQHVARLLYECTFGRLRHHLAKAHGHDGGERNLRNGHERGHHWLKDWEREGSP